MSCSFPNTHTTQNQSQDSIDSMHDSHNTQGQPIIYLLNCENRKTYPIALQANTDTNGNIIQDKADNTSYNTILSTELNLDMKATTKLILSCNDLVAQHYSTYDIHKITGVGIVSVNYDLKQKAKKGESIIYKNVLQLKQTTTLDEMITNTDSILEVRINNTQKPLRIDTTLECEALYYGYKLIQWAYMILPTKEYNPHKTKLQKDIDYYELPSDTYKGNIISFNPKEYLQSKDNAPSNQPNSKDNPPNYSQQLQYLTQGDYTLVIFAYQKTPAYHTTHYIQDVTTNQSIARQATTHTKLDYKPPLSLRFNGKELQILEWGEMKEHYRIYSKEYDSIDTKDMPRLLSSYSLAPDVIDIERYYTSSHHKDQDIIDSMKQDTSLPKGNYYLYTKDIEQSLKIQTDFYTRARGYNALNIYTIDTNNQYKISYYNNPLDNIPYPKGTTFLTTPNTPIPTHYTDERVKIFLKGSKTYKDFILNLKQKIDSIQSQYEIERVRLEVGYENIPNYYIDSEGYIFWNINEKNRIRKLPNGLVWSKKLKRHITHSELEARLNLGKMPKENVKGIVLHMTYGSNINGAITHWFDKANKTGTHFIIEAGHDYMGRINTINPNNDGTIYQLLTLNSYAGHVGQLRDKRYPLSKESIGIEVVGLYNEKTKEYPRPTDAQLESCYHLVRILAHYFGIDKSRIYAHGRISKKDINMTEGVHLLEYILRKWQ